jgi:lactoylglutathione lyase
MNQFICLKKSSLPHAFALLAAGALATAAPSLPAADAPGEFSKGVIDLGLVVRDAGRTAQFLTNAIGFTEVKGFAVTPEMGRKIGLVDGHAVDVRVFTLTEGDLATRIKVLSFPNAKAKPADQKFIHSTLGLRYLTLYVKDMNRALERLKTAKAALLGETPLDLGGGNFIAVCKDPDGNFFELIGPMKK